jgi:hypothetical protein
MTYSEVSKKLPKFALGLRQGIKESWKSDLIRISVLRNRVKSELALAAIGENPLTLNQCRSLQMFLRNTIQYY